MVKKIICLFLAVAAGIVAASPVRIIRMIDTSQTHNLQLDVLRQETVEVRVRVTSYGDPIDLRGWSVVMHGRTNGQSEAESYQVRGVAGIIGEPESAAAGWMSAQVDVDAWWPVNAGSGMWTLAASDPNDDVRIMRAGGPLTIRGTAAANAQAPLPLSNTDALRAEFYAATTSIVTTAIATLVPPMTVAGALRVISPATNAWISVDPDGTGRVNRISVQPTTNRAAATAIAIVGSSGPYNGPPPGTLFMRCHDMPNPEAWSGGEMWTNGIWVIAVYDDYNVSYELRVEDISVFPGMWQVLSHPTLPATLAGNSGGLGEVTLSWVQPTNIVTRIATSDDVAAIPRVPTNSLQGWLMWDTGSNVWLRVAVSNYSFTIWEVEL